MRTHSRLLLRRTAKILAMTAAVGLLVLAALKLVLDATYYHGYDGTIPPDVRIAETKETPAYLCSRFTFDGFRGERVPAVLATPKHGRGPFPCVIFLHGIGQDKEFMAANRLDQPFVEAGFAFVCFDQLTRGERKTPLTSAWSKAAAFRARAAYTVNDTRRLMDYLASRPDIARDRIYLCGASYGAITGCIVTAQDPRIRAVALVYGGGNLWRLLSADGVREEFGFWSLGTFATAWYFCSVFDPVQYAAQIAPRPIFFQNGKADTVVAPAAAQALQDAARQPKTILWYEGDHLGLNKDLDQSLIPRVLADALRFIQEADHARQ